MIQEQIRNKLINAITLKGKKNTGEKLLLKCLKKMQKNSKNKSIELIQLAIINAIPIFKLQIIENDKEKKKKVSAKKIPFFIANSQTKIALALKIIVMNAKKASSKVFKNKLFQEILLNSQEKGQAVLHKNELQKEVFLNKNYLLYYKWA